MEKRVESLMSKFLFRVFEVEKSFAEDLKAEVNSYVFTHLTISKENAFSKIDHIALLEHCPKLSAYLGSLGLKTTIAGLVRSWPRQVAKQPHIDSYPQNLAMNFPVQDCENSVTNFYEPYNEDGTPPVMTQFQHPNGVKGSNYRDASWRLLGSVTLAGPTLLNIKVPHKVDHHGDLIRVSLSLRFERDPWHLTSE